jgi:inorganic pyrophosphatase
MVVIETPKGSPNKLTFEPRYGTFVLKGVLPVGAVFPFDIGFVPSTRAEDGDPLDILVLMDAPVFPGCIVPSRLVGVIEAEQTEDGKTERNDRLLAVAASPLHTDRFTSCAI